MRVLLLLSAVFQQDPAACRIARGRAGLRRGALSRPGLPPGAAPARLLGLPVLGLLIGKLEAEKLLHLLGNLVAAGVEWRRRSP